MNDYSDTKEFILKMGGGIPILETVTRKCFVKQTHKKHCEKPKRCQLETIRA